MKRTRAGPKSANQLGASDVVDRLLDLRRLVREVEGRGGIVRVMQMAGLDGPREGAVVAALEFAWKSLRGFTVRIGDDRRARGQSVPLGWLPSDDGPTADGGRHRP
jgi:hypothetical protein